MQQLATKSTQDNNTTVLPDMTPDSEIEKHNFTIEQEQKEEEIRISGNRVVDFMYLFEQLQNISHHNSPFGCNFSHLRLVAEKKKGFISKFIFVCKMCKAKLKLRNCRELENKKELDLNENVVSSFMSIGAGYTGLVQVSASLEIPSMSDYLYAKCHAKVCQLWELAKEKCMAEAAKEDHSKIMSRLVNNAKSLIHNVNSNIAEVFNSVIAKFVGGKRINYSTRQSYTARCAGSVVSFNSKQPQTYLCKKIFMRSPNPLIKRVEINRDKKRIASLKRQLSKSFLSVKKQNKNNNTNDKDYGDSCQKPDMSETDFEFAKSEHLKKINLSEEERLSLEKRTILQADSIEWHQERKLRLTASSFGKVCKRGAIKCAPLVKSLLNVSGDLNHVKSIRYGKENESVAIENLNEVLNCNEDNTFNGIKKCGLFIDQEFPFLAASPDGILNDEIIEIKCPYSAKDMTVLEGVAQKKITFWKQHKNGNLVINKNHDWFYQSQDSRLDRKMDIREPEYILEAIKKKEATKRKQNLKQPVTKRKKANENE
ncbi:yqaJ-like viral recombinase domain-containing protein [Phthorimaea operculella]|nr:yqaJ-like viral recombinase domain-containing protein [Phthorimaea operculella]